jgi:Mechanosensitive ion channel, conserved TM helix
MPPYVDTAVNTLVAFLPSLIAAVLLLIVGYIVARVVSGLVKRLLGRTGLDNRLARSLSGTGLGSEGAVASVVFWLIMLFVLIGFFQTLQLAAVSTPLGLLLGQVLAFIPRLLGAALLLLLAWVVASVLKRVVTGILSGMGIDRRLDRLVGQEPTENTSYQRPVTSPESAPAPRPGAYDEPARVSLADTLGDVVYWLVFLLFLPAILGALDLGGILEPVQVMLTRILAYLPNVVAAGLILLVGWFVARIVRRIVTGLLAAAGFDRLGERVGLRQVLGRQTLSGLVGLLAYIFILVPVLISALNALQVEAVTRPATNMLDTFLTAIPNIFAAAMVLAIAYIVGRLVAGLVTNLLAGVGFDTVPARLGLTSGTPTVGRRMPSEIVGALVLVAVMLFATVEAFRLLNFTALADLLAELVQLGGQVILGLIILAIGAYLANLAADLIRSSGTSNASLLALIARVAILVLAGAMALRQMGIANEIVNLAFGLLLGAVAVAAALAFGFGGREVAGRELEDWVRQVKARARTDRGDPAPRRPLSTPLGASPRPVDGPSSPGSPGMPTIAPDRPPLA